MDLEQALARLALHRTDEVVVTTMSANLIWPAYSKIDADLIFTAPMGGVPAAALGIALARPDVGVWAFNGDGSTLMYLSSLVTIADAMPKNLVLFVMNNTEWGLIGHLSLPAAGRVDFPGIARSAGWTSVERITSLDELDAAMPRIRQAAGPTFVELVVEPVAKLQAGTKEYAERMALPKARASYGKSGAEKVQAYLAAKR